jgi:hypothetical protein
LGKDVLLYKELSVYYTGDYAHVVLGYHGACQILRHPTKSRPGLVQRAVRKITRPIIESRKPIWNSKQYRKVLVESRLSSNNHPHES